MGYRWRDSGSGNFSAAIVSDSADWVTVWPNQPGGIFDVEAAWFATPLDVDPVSAWSAVKIIAT